VVPAPPERLSHDPFAADIDDGYIYGRGAVDMKGMVSLQVGLIERLATEARTAGRDPAADPIPGLKRDLLFTCSADEEAGSTDGARWLAIHRPDWLRAAGALNECGGLSVTVDGVRFYPIMVAEKGYAPYRIHVSGTWGHGSMPRPENAAVRAAEIVQRLAAPGPVRVTPIVARMLTTAADALPAATGSVLRTIARGELEPAAADRALDRLCDAVWSRALRALMRDTYSPNIVHAGVKYNIIPGDATVEVDCRMLPGTTEADVVAELERHRPGAPAGLPAGAPVARGAGRGTRRGTDLGHAGRGARRSRPGGDPPPRDGAVRDRCQGDGVGRHADIWLRAIPARTRRAIPRALARHRRADLARRPQVRAARPVRRRPSLLRLTWRPRPTRSGPRSTAPAEDRSRGPAPGRTCR